jgi:hypothetical protein
MPIPLDLIPRIFPGIATAPWRPLGVTLTGKVALVAAHIAKRLDGGKSVTIAKSELKQAAGIKSDNLYKMWRHPSLADWLEHHGLTMTVALPAITVQRIDPSRSR